MMTDGIEEDVGCAVVMVGMRMNSFVVTKDYFDIFIIVYILFFVDIARHYSTTNHTHVVSSKVNLSTDQTIQLRFTR